MYVIVVLCIMQIYQFRHQDVYASAPVTFGVLVFIILFGTIGDINCSLSLRIVFTIFYLPIYFVASIIVYYNGEWAKEKSGLFRFILKVNKRKLKFIFQYER